MRGRTLAWLAMLCLFHLPALASNTEQTYEGAGVLASGLPVSVDVSPESSVRLGFEAAGRTADQVVIQQSDAELTFHALAPDGTEIAKVSSGYPGVLIFSFPTPAEGRYHLLIECKKISGSADRVTVRLGPALEAGADLIQAMHAEQIFSIAQTSRARPAARDVLQATQLYQKAGEIWRALHNNQGQMIALAAEGAAWLDLSHYQRALRCYSLAESLSDGHADWQATLLNGRARVYLDMGDGDAALPLALRAFHISSGTEDSAQVADALAIRGEANYLQSNEDEAWSDLAQATVSAQRHQDRLTLARILRAQSWVEQDRGHLVQSAQKMREAEQIFREIGDVRDSTEAICDTATIDGMTGNLYSAILRHSSVLQLIRTSGQVAMEGYATETIGSDYAALNRDGDAIPYFESAFKLFLSIQHISGEQTSSGELCTSELRLGLLQDAYAHCRKSERLALVVHDRKREAISQWRLGELFEAMGRFGEAAQFYRGAASLSKSVNDPRFESSALVDLGNLKDKQSDHAAAIELYTSALQLSLQAEDRDGMVAARYHVAKAEAALGRIDEAKNQLDEAIQSAEEERSHVQNDQLRTSYFTSLRKCYELLVDIFMTQHRREPTYGFDRLALEKSEAGRARTLLDSISNRRNFAPGSGRADETPESAQLHRLLDQAYEKRLNLMLQPKGDQDLSKNAADIRSLISQYDRAQDLSSRAPRIIATDSQPLSGQQIIDRARDSGGLTLEYSLGEDRSYLWKIDHGVLTSFVLPGRPAIARDVERWRSLTLARVRKPGEQFFSYVRRVEVADRELPKVAARLSCTLLGPRLQTTGSQLGIVADGILQSFPFSALPLNGCEHIGGPPLITAFEVVNLPSISAAAAARMRDREKTGFKGDVAILADPVFSQDDPRVHGRGESVSRGLPSPALDSALRDVGFRTGLPRLIATRREAEAIAAMVPPDKVFLALDFQASLETALGNEMSGYRILHFATHGLLDAKSPDLSGLVLSLVDPAGHPVPGYLQAQDIFNLSLHPELVVLSACNSGLGEEIDGEGTVGIAYAFLHGGAKRVVSTLWDVDDEGSSRLMQNFYRALLKRNEEPSAALRNAQIEMMRRKSTSEPFYWAGYTMTAYFP
jgi:tetratricopeptide (TPR) repeat protein